MSSQFRRFRERQRPIYHYTTESKWLNDPNGLVYHDGEYHLYYQYNCFGQVHWGHAVSTDLVHWEQQPSAIYPRQDGEDWLQPWSGTVVVDRQNSSGLQTGEAPVFLAYFTHSRQPGDFQSQSMAYSNDCGYTWTEYSHNPVIANPGIHDFRDPKVFWHRETERWIMAVVAGDHVKFYSSANGLQWTWESDFGREEGAHGGVWECPDLFPLRIAGEPSEKWVLIVSVGDGAIAGGTGMQYFIGHFDGHAYRTDDSKAEPRWVDYGQDFYAAISWNEVPDGRRLWIGWMNNWPYANSLPTDPYQGQMSIVRELRLMRAETDELYLAQSPVEGLHALRKAQFQWEELRTEDRLADLLADVRSECFEIEAEARWDENEEPDDIQLRLRMRDRQYTAVGFHPKRQLYYLDRSKSGLLPHSSFGGRHEAARDERACQAKWRIFVDRQSVEVFADEGRYVWSDLIFPEPGSDRMQWHISGGKAVLVKCRIYPFRSALPGDTEKPVLQGNAVSGQWGVTSQGVEGAAFDTGLWLIPVENNDFMLQADIEIVQGFRHDRASGLAFRMNPSGTKGYVAVYEPGSAALGLYRLTPVGVQTVERIGVELNNLKRFTLKVNVRGQRIQICLNGSSVIEVLEPNAYTNGSAGLYLRHSLALYNNIEQDNS